MDCKKISHLFDSDGLTISRSTERTIFDLKYNDIIFLFEKYGVILFRGFEIEGSDITNFTDIYTEQYSSDTNRRNIRFGNRNIRNVDYGNSEVLLHSEASFTPSLPEIVWLFCNIPATDGGESILCDGVRLWKSLSNDTKGFFLSEQIHYELKIPVFEGKDRNIIKPWLLQVVGAGMGHINYNDGCLYITQKRYAVQKARNGELSFCNHLFVSLDSEPQLLSRRLSDGTEIPDEIYTEIKIKAEKITYKHVWEKNDLLMVDNLRFMHGRSSLIPGVPRDVVVLQSQIASFGYGFANRKSISGNL
jgi:alpha-ketoglutarate-dependent taurine dioxygenase